MAASLGSPEWRREYERSLENPASFWEKQAGQLPWLEQPTDILSQDANGTIRWFAGGLTNTCWLALDRHCDEGRQDQTALIYDSPVTGQIQHFSFRELRDLVARAAGMLRAQGVEKGDRVIIYMPMIPEAIISMLACARLGAIHSVVFGGFAAPELAARIDDAEPKVLLAASCGIEFATTIPYMPMVEEALRLARKAPRSCIIKQREECPAELRASRDLDWDALMQDATPADYVSLDATDPLYILYTSGTTGRPKGVLRDTGGHSVALNYSMSAIYDTHPGEVFWAASDVGWVVGHSYIAYAPLIRGCTSVLYEGKPVRTPDAGAIWRVIESHSVRTFFVAPTAFRAVRKEDPDASLLARHDISSLRNLFIAGERLDPPTYHWLSEHVDVPVIDHWWQTETGWSICANPAGLGLVPPKPGSVSLPVPGYDLRVVDDDGREVAAGVDGNIVLAQPLPPGNLFSVWGDHERYLKSYWSQFPGYYLTGDGGFRDEDGYVFIMGRNDDVMNVAGHRLSSGELEEVIADHPAVAECAVVGMRDETRGQVPLGVLVLKDGVNIDASTLEAELIAKVRAEIGAFAYFRQAVVVPRLPKTRSGKILRNLIRKLADGDEWSMPPTIEDEAVVAEISSALKG